MRAVPAVGIMKPANIRMVVDLPAPFGPRKPSTSPRATLKLTRSTAVKLPNRFVSPSISISTGCPATPAAISWFPRRAAGIAEFRCNASRSATDDKGLTERYAALQREQDERKRHASRVD